MKFLKPTMLIFSVLIMVIIVIAIMQVFAGWVYPKDGLIIMTACLIVFCLTVILSLFGQKFNARKLGFYILHIGLVLFITGNLVYNYSGSYVQVATTISSNTTFSRIQEADGSILELGFEIGISEFLIEYYQPVYDIYSIEPTKLIKSDIEMDKDGNYDFGTYGVYNINLLETNDGVKDMFLLADNVAAVVRMPVSYYEGTVQVFNEGENQQTKSIAVNKPLRVGKWKIYLMGYIEETQQVILVFKQDSGEILSDISIYLIMIGAIHCCLIAPATNKKKTSIKLQGGR